MIEVKFIKSMISNVAPHKRGDVAVVDESTAKKYIQAGICVAVRTEERAEAKPQVPNAKVRRRRK